MPKILKKIDNFLDRHTTLWVFLLIMVVLRVPNLFDPYWYGDEAIYLTIGQSIRAGRGLYTSIIDHKTPIIYYLAAVPNQFWFRVLLIFWMIVSTIAFYCLSLKLFKNKYYTWISLAVFVLLTTLPWFEGHIPNGELFVMGFVLVGLWLASKTKFMKPLLITDKKRQSKASKLPYLWLAGSLYGLGILTKVPALLDLAGILSIAWFVFTGNVMDKPKKWLQSLVELFKQISPLLIGALVPILLSILYFVMRGAGQDYLRFGLLYNLHYSQSWQLDLGSNLLNFLFSMTGKTTVLFGTIVILSLIKSLSIKFKFFSAWGLLTLYAVLLSNRPYPHYFLQSIPPLAWLVTTIVEHIVDFIKAKNKKINQLTAPVAGVGLIAVSFISLSMLNFGTYNVRRYYQNFYKFMKGSITQEEYRQSFNYLMTDNYKLSNFLLRNQVEELFIWGNNPMLYASSKTVPVSRFTVAFHITDVDAYDQTLEEVQKTDPKYIVVMQNAPNDFYDFYDYLDQNYLPNHSFEHMTLYKKVQHK